MNTTFQRTDNSQEWYTPKYIIDDLGPFDLDPCSSINPLYKIADKTYTVETDGLSHEWEGRVWLNPPYKHPVIDRFIDKMVRHKNGIALIFSRCDNSLWQNKIFPTISAIKFIHGRVRFLNFEGKIIDNPGCGSALVSWGKECAEILRRSRLKGYFIELNNQ